MRTELMVVNVMVHTFCMVKRATWKASRVDTVCARRKTNNLVARFRPELFNAQS